MGADAWAGTNGDDGDDGIVTEDGMITGTSTSAEFGAILIIITIFTSNLKIISNVAVSPRNVSQEISPSHQHQVCSSSYIAT